ncbi:MAG: glycosyltransferase family A protein [Reichenbachiella sp.]|uniref:glycosyltransferase family A protein n=1 Tax=Reichenbachiella sp. TaxID=2184521 RepID=UPI00296606FC|nr:glycosyltransferase family A protein [Reichenbachiella sp.]MDW3209337.1 glycosyltransferase family A protein [Reichenbachiella sp.]
MKNKLPIIVSLTSIQSKLDRASLTIQSILDQSVKADRVVLWLSEEAHLADDGIQEIPNSLKELVDKGLEIRWTKNIGAYRKLIPTAKLMNHESCLIVTAADDVLYPSNWLRGLKEEYYKNEGCVICYQGRIMDKAASWSKWTAGKKLKPYQQWIKTNEVTDKSKLGPNIELFPDGKGGVLYPSDRLHEEIFNKSVYLKMAPTDEDIWFKTITMMTDTKVKCIENTYNLPETEQTINSRFFGLLKSDSNDQLIHQLLERYQLI